MAQASTKKVILIVAGLAVGLPCVVCGSCMALGVVGSSAGPRPGDSRTGADESATAAHEEGATQETGAGSDDEPTATGAARAADLGANHEGPIEHTIHSTERHDIPLKASVALRVVASPSATDSEVRQLLLHIYEDQRRRGGWRHHERTTHVFVYLHGSEHSAEAGQGGWFAMLKWIRGDDEPEIIIDHARMVALQEEPTERFGMTEAERRAVFLELAEAEGRAMDEAFERHGTDMQAVGRLSSELEERYTRRVRREHGLTVAQAEAIGLEGVRKGWPSFRTQ